MKTVVLKVHSGIYSDALNILEFSVTLTLTPFFFFKVKKLQGKPSPDKCSKIYGF